MRYIREALAGGGTLSIKSKFPGKLYLVATMSWDEYDPISTEMSLGVESALEKLDALLEEDCNNPAQL